MGETKEDEDPRKSISAAPSFEEYISREMPTHKLFLKNSRIDPPWDRLQGNGVIVTVNNISPYTYRGHRVGTTASDDIFRVGHIWALVGTTTGDNMLPSTHTASSRHYCWRINHNIEILIS